MTFKDQRICGRLMHREHDAGIHDAHCFNRLFNVHYKSPADGKKRKVDFPETAHFRDYIGISGKVYCHTLNLDQVPHKIAFMMDFSGGMPFLSIIGVHCSNNDVPILDCISRFDESDLVALDSALAAPRCNDQTVRLDDSGQRLRLEMVFVS